MKKIVLSFYAVLWSLSISAQTQIPLYLDDSKPIEDRIEDALQRMTLREKINIIHSQSKFSAPGVPRLGIPEIWTSDGPMGVRPEVFWDEWVQAGWTNDSITAFPALVSLAATWNKDLALKYGKSIGEEARYRNKSVLLGPGVNIYRTPLCGRNFEYLGEDPYLSSRMAVGYINGVQSNGVSVCVKHFAMNNNEINRLTSNVLADDRTVYEIYLPAFKAAAIEAHAWSFMGGYNLFRGEHATSNSILVNKILKREWNWDGVVISDWGAVFDTKTAVEGGVDMEFGTLDGAPKNTSNIHDEFYLALPYMKGILNGIYSQKELDDKVRRVLRLTMRTSMNRNRPFGSLVSDEHMEVCRTIGEEGIVLLKNATNLLPIDLDKSPKILVVGENAIKKMTVGGGSSSLKAKYEITPLEGIKARMSSKAEIVFARGYVGDISNSFRNVSTGQDLSDSRSPEELLEEAVNLAKDVDYVIYIGGLNKGSHFDCEGDDRISLELPYNQDNIIRSLYKANKKLIVVNISGSGVAMPWAKEIPTILQSWYLGNEAGNALAAVLCGDVNPSGKLPYTYYASLDQCGAHKEGEYPGHEGYDKLGNKVFDINYNEGIYVGYRYTEKNNITPTFPFGHGLSYTLFKYGKATLDKSYMYENGTITITVPITNVGSLKGKEVVQLYIQDDKSTVDRPIKELKDFAKVELAPGETSEVSFTIDKTALSYFDEKKHEWVAEAGLFTAHIGSSSADIRTKVRFELK